MAFTRRVHVVRCYSIDPDAAITNPDNSLSSPYIDIKVLDAVSVLTASGDEAQFEVMQTADAEAQTDNDDISGNGGEERVYDVAAVNAVPSITDKTGDGNQKIVAKGATRATHMQIFIDINNPSNTFDGEILDAFCVKGPNGSELVINIPVAYIDPSNPDSVPPPSNSELVEAINDPTGSGFGVAHSAKTTRASHIVKVIASLETTLTDGSVVFSKDDTRYILAKIVDAIAFQGPNGEEFLLNIPASADSENDTTLYHYDNAGQKVPPQNKDPDPYVFLQTKRGVGNPFIGKGMPVGFGPLWWVVGCGYEHDVIPPVVPKTYTGFYILYPPTQELTNYEYGTFDDELKWEAIGTTTFNGPFSLEAAIATGHASGPFTSSLANFLLDQANGWIGTYNVAGITNGGSFPAIDIVEPPGVLAGEVQFVLESTGGTWPASPSVGTTFQTLPTFIVESQDGLINPPYGG